MSPDPRWDWGEESTEKGGEVIILDGGENKLDLLAFYEGDPGKAGGGKGNEKVA